ncbi:MAG: hypothetical protein WB791_03905 [Waddliaceae bacterium]
MSGETSTCALSTEIAKSQFAHGVKEVKKYLHQHSVISELNKVFSFLAKRSEPRCFVEDEREAVKQILEILQHNQVYSLQGGTVAI